MVRIRRVKPGEMMRVSAGLRVPLIRVYKVDRAR